MSFVVVEDVAASWEQYERVSAALAETAPAGLIVHAAGPTDEGFRMVGVWESEAAWRRFEAELPPEPEGRAAPQVVRELRPEHIVYGRREEEEPA